MGINNNYKNKKEAAALVLILIVLTSLAIIIASTMKILIGSDSRFSHNRNARGGGGNTTTGKFLCYKKWENGVYKLYQKRVDYAADGSISDIQDNETPVSQCNFQIPQGVNNYEIIIVAGGGAGGNSSYEMGYETLQCNALSIKNHSDIEECETARKTILDNIFIELICNIEFKTENAFCSTANTSKKSLLQFNENEYNQELYEIEANSRNYGLHYDESEEEYVCKNYSDGAYSNRTPNLSYSLKIDYGIGNSLSTPVYSTNYSDIINALDQVLKHTNYSVKKPFYYIYSGQPGNAGSATVLNLKGSIYGKDGENFIIIKPEDIGNAGRKSEGGKTTFSYWHKNSSEETYTEVKHLSNGGIAGVKPSNPSTVFKSGAEVEPIRSHEGIMPDYLKIPSAFKFSNLYAGYIKNSGEPVDATFFGASGASGKINEISTEKLTNCTHIEYKLDSTHIKEYDFDNNNYNAVKYSCTTGEIADKSGSNGAPGAILISW